MVNTVDAKTFMTNALGGRPNQAQMNIYEGMPYECGCGKTHTFSENTIGVIQELEGLKFVFVAECGYGALVLVQTKAFFSLEFVTIMSCSMESMNELTEEDLADALMKNKFNL